MDEHGASPRRGGMRGTPGSVATATQTVKKTAAKPTGRFRFLGIADAGMLAD
jgi:hypothetical protein